MHPTYPAKLASTASGMSFEEWRRRPVYATHCKTFKVAQSLCGIQLGPGLGLATVLNGDDGTGLSTFRCLPAYRTPQGNRLRDAVAKEIRNQRHSRALNA